MRRSAWIFVAAIFLPSLGLAWLAVHSVQDQQVVLEHQQAIISQNITDALAKSINGRMDQIRSDFVQTTQQLLGESQTPQMLAHDFNRKLRAAWPPAEIGFAVNLDGEIYSPAPYDGSDARTFRDENDRFLSNRENVEVYSSNSVVINQAASTLQNAPAVFDLKKPDQAGQIVTATGGSPALTAQNSSPVPAQAKANLLKEKAKDSLRDTDLVSTVTDTSTTTKSGTGLARSRPSSSRENAKALSLDLSAQTASPTTVPSPAPREEYTDSLSMAAGSVSPAQNKAVSPPSATATASMAVPTVPQSSGPSDRETTMKHASTEQAPAQAVQTVFSGTLQNAQSFAKIQRQVIPQQMLARETASLSNTVPEESDFRRVIGSETSGALARFLENKMRLMVWSHATADAPVVFGAQLDQGKVVETLKSSFQIPELAGDPASRASGGEVCVAILNDSGQPVALSRPGFKNDWKHPFVATEIGEALPHWEAALYLVDPGQISRAARTLRATLGLIVLLLVAAIVSGGSLIAADVRRQVRLARQKTDFVSNVSHELKTPLTSIRMFADLLAERRVPNEERQATYLRIIAAEAARLTRLINNVLDFARLERGAPSGKHRPCDLVDAVRDVVETCGPHLEAAGLSFRHEIEAETLPISGDRDALAQIILNLVSNAEKYGGSEVLVRVRRQKVSSGALGCVDVLDRGPGIPARQVKLIFEPFRRLDDSLSSEIPGSGLGLTLARRMARMHGGDVTYSPRAGGGSCFTLTVPLAYFSETT